MNASTTNYLNSREVRKHYVKNAIKIRAKSRANYCKNKPDIQKKKRIYGIKNREKIRIKRRLYIKNNRYRMNLLEAKRRLKNNLPGEELLTRYRRMIVSVNGSSELQVLSDFIVSLGIADSRVLKKKYLDMVPDVSFTYSHNCTNCGHAMEGGVPIGTDFFWPQL